MKRINLLPLFIFAFSLLILTSCGECKHEWMRESTTEATCTEPGTMTERCEKCGEKRTNNISPALGHHSVIDEEKYATCTEDGLTQGQHCKNCNEVLVPQETIPAKGHKEENDLGYPATCETTGLTDGKHCQQCTNVIVPQEVIPALGHTEVVDKGYAATCYLDGLTDGKHCTVCKKTTVAQEVIPALGHEFDSDNKCTICGDEKPSEGLQLDRYSDAVTNEGYYMLVGIGSCTDTEIIIPRYYNGLPVKVIDWNAFNNNSNITKVTIPNSIEQIGLNAFRNCSSLTTVIFEEGINVKIDSSAFLESNSIKYTEYFECKYLGNEENPYNVLVSVVNRDCLSLSIHEDTVNIADRAIQNCGKITSIVMTNVEIIGTSAFEGCGNLTSVTLNEGLKYIGSSAFYDCDKLTSVEIPSTVEKIQIRAFGDCSSLTNVYLPNKAIEMDEDAFIDSVNLEYNEYQGGFYLGNEENPYNVLVKVDTSIESFTTHENTKVVLRKTFTLCESLKSAKFTGNIEIFGDNGTTAGVFQQCASLETIVFEEGITTIEGLFMRIGDDGKNVKNIYLPKSLVYISLCNTNFDNLTIYYAGSKDDWFDVKREDFAFSNNITYVYDKQPE